METPAAPRQTLAMRMAERSRLRAERAERLARLAPRGERAARTAEAPPVSPPVAFSGAARPEVPVIGSEGDAAAALEEFLRSLTQGFGGGQPDVPPAPGEVLPFQRPATPEPRESEAPARPGDAFGRLAGVGPGLAWALRRAGIPDLASVAALEPEALAARLGPLGRLVPARVWIEAARAAPDHP